MDILYRSWISSNCGGQWDQVLCYTGHVLGAAMFMVDIAGVRVLYTGDYSREEDRHLRAAEMPQFSPDVSRAVREKRFTDVVHQTAQGGRKCMLVYQTYINGMNDKIQSQCGISNPFNFTYIHPLKNVESFEDDGPSVVMASPGGLQSGLSRQLFEMWCQDKKKCMYPGYVNISFSAHADFNQTNAFLSELRPPNIILVHGEANEMARLKAKLQTQFAEQNVNVLSPRNCQTVEMFFKGEKTAKAIGCLAEKVPTEGDSVSGLLVKKGFTYQLMSPEDLHVYTQLSTGSVMQRQSVPYKGAFVVLKHRLQQMFEKVIMLPEADTDVPSLNGTDFVVLQWVSDPVNDMVADSIVATILKLNTRPLPSLDPNNLDKKDNVVAKNGLKIVESLFISLFGDNVKERIKLAFGRLQSALHPLSL
ncbi:hypothetical protein KP509_1Z259500 [Ceratopteris richardii]|nr:hypothetical protein KP509_1Z259500 [Ceratopteris richardii]